MHSVRIDLYINSCYLVIIISNSVDSPMNFNCFRVRSHIKKTTDQRGSVCASGAGSAKVLGIKETPGSSAWGAAKCGIAVPRKLYGGVVLWDGTRGFDLEHISF